MRTKPAPGRRSFASTRDEAEYLYDKLLYWLYERDNPVRARFFADRLGRLLLHASPGHEAIFPEECRSLICEANGDLGGAIKHRVKEIRLMKRLQEISVGTPHEDDILRLHSFADLSDRLDLLAELYREKGDLDKAIAALRESRSVCEKHGIKFDGADLLRECVKEKRLQG
jgi:hypothetical protein